MNELFETVLILSLFGFGIIALLLLLKPITVKQFPAKWQYYVWTMVLVSMIVPIYRFIPEKEVQRFSSAYENEIIQPEYIAPTENTSTNENIELPPTTDNNTDDKPTVKLQEYLQNFLDETRDVFAVLWMTGVIIYIIAIIVCYCIYLMRKRKNSFLVADNKVFENTKKELGIKRKIKLKVSNDIKSPMLVGILFPTIYIPAKDISDENMRMVFLHELTHYKRCDLIIKWLSLFVNSIHWFNPLAYLLCANISESCEISCDMEVTRNMSETQQKIYMKTILDLAE